MNCIQRERLEISAQFAGLPVVSVSGAAPRLGARAVAALASSRGRGAATFLPRRGSWA